MNSTTIYTECPLYPGERVTLRQTKTEDAAELLKCYSDEKAVPFFNDDNCLDNFHYSTLEQMQQEILFWCESYQNRGFVRWTLIHHETSERIGTVEMFHRGVLAGIGSHGILRIDLRSHYENRSILQDILKIADRHFYRDFDVTNILTKAIPEAKERILALEQMGYELFSFEKEHYYIKHKDH